MTLDYPEDYEFFTTTIEGLEKDQQSLEFKNIMNFLHDHPEIVEINKKLQETYDEHLKQSMQDR
jgi:spore coat polysaccharide biosynthesis protein SpsF (cytidylyltransferase family)